MEEAVRSQWALVVRNDGEASVVPLREVSDIQEDERVSGDKNQTIIVLQTQEQDGLGLDSSEKVSESDLLGEREMEDVTDFITVSAGQEEETNDPLKITIADTSHRISPIGPDSVDSISISVLDPSEVSQTNPQKPSTADSIPVGYEGQSLDSPTSTIVAAVDNTTSLESSKLTSVKRETHPPVSTSSHEESREATKQWKRRENFKTPDFKFKSESDTKEQRKDYFDKVYKRSQKPACTRNLIEPFERLEATLHKDIAAELGLPLSKNIFTRLKQHCEDQEVKVTETGHDHIVVSGSFTQLLASRDMILEEIRKLRGLSKEAKLPSKHDVGVMCELIPSPSTPFHASILRLDRSTRRKHSILSCSLSPENNPLNRRSKKQLMAHSKPKNSDKRHLMKGFTERLVKKRPHNHIGNKVECESKSQNKNNTISKHSYQESQEEDSKVSVALIDVQAKASGFQTIFVSQTSLAKNENIENKYVSNLNPPCVNEEDNIPVRLPVKEVDGTKLLEGTVYASDKNISNRENISSECFSANRTKEKKQENKAEFIVKEESNFDHKEVSKKTEKIQETSKSNHVKFKFCCKICSYKSMRENHFSKHMQLHDKGLSLYRCSECSFVSIRLSHLRRHKMSHAQQVLHCHLCAYTCDEQKLLAKHIRVKHHTPKQPNTSDDIFECEECEYKTTWHYAFQRHRRTHTSSKVVVINSCPQCNYKTVRREHFLRHIKNVHQNYRPFLCDICGKAFKRQDALKQHHVCHYQSMSASTSTGEMVPQGFVCHICQKMCRSAAYLKEHMATHSEERSFLCEVCGASFKTRSVQRNHVQTIHRRPRAFTCATCDKKFNTRFALRRHMKQHDTSIQMDIEELQDPTRNLEASSEFGRLCNLEDPSPTLLPQTTPSLVHLPIQSRPPLPTMPESAYQITIDGQPALLVPHLDTQHTTIESGERCITKAGSTAGLVANGDADLPALGRTQANTAVSVSVVPATVHILNQQNTLSASSNDLMVSSEHCDGDQGTSEATCDTTNYINTEHGNSTLLYLTANFN